MYRVLKASLLLWFVLLLAVAILGGCKTEDIAPGIARAVNTYCTQPQEERLLLRKRVNTLTAPHTIAVTCQGDTP